jgi:sterol desaturase/sphingolipid hydroxylase (fatty acid hydroxylase superfamily)
MPPRVPVAWFLVIAASFAGFLFASERIWGVHERPLLRRGLFADALYAPMHVALRILFRSSIGVGFTQLGSHVLPQEWTHVLAGRPLWIQTMVLLLVLDLFFYVMHRLKHRWQWWWRLHETHHSSVDLDFFASVRFHPLEKIVDRAIFLAPMMILGPSTEAILIWSSCDVFFGMFGHANLAWKLGPLKYLLVGPEMHRWHHVKDPAVRECNFSNNFALFDWFFGTAYVTAGEPSDFGVDDPNYPVENIAKQFVYAFRPPETHAPVHGQTALRPAEDSTNG